MFCFLILTITKGGELAGGVRTHRSFLDIFRRDESSAIVTQCRWRHCNACICCWEEEFARKRQIRKQRLRNLLLKRNITGIFVAPVTVFSAAVSRRTLIGRAAVVVFYRLFACYMLSAKSYGFQQLGCLLVPLRREKNGHV